ncbi:MAG: sensor histidine kinase [Gluconacetobacter diazotrophicus]|nr:sensor histidine kinase [Gluconacetobacter diazotrophicus]
MAATFRRQPLWLLYANALVQVAVCGIFDYVTGYELAVYPIYAAPILFLVWFGGRLPAAVISVVCTLVWWWADVAAGHAYTNGWFQAWDLVVRLMFFLVVAFAGLAFKENRDTVDARVRLLEHSQRLESEIISVSERERQRIGRDLHDGVCQYLAAIGLTADLLRQNLALENHPRAEAVGEIAALLQDAVDRAREVARGLSPVDRDEGGLESALEELAFSTTRLTGITCDFICPEPLPVRDNIRAVHLFRIAQEAVGNATRHARARNVIIALEASDGDLALRVSDDGTGFDPAAVHAHARGGMGLNTMRYRARTLGGTLEIEPNFPTGTVVTCTVRPAVDATEVNAASTLGVEGTAYAHHRH